MSPSLYNHLVGWDDYNLTKNHKRRGSHDAPGWGGVAKNQVSSGVWSRNLSTEAAVSGNRYLCTHLGWRAKAYGDFPIWRLISFSTSGDRFLYKDNNPALLINSHRNTVYPLSLISWATAWIRRTWNFSKLSICCSIMTFVFGRLFKFLFNDVVLPIL